MEARLRKEKEEKERLEREHEAAKKAAAEAAAESARREEMEKTAVIIKLILWMHCFILLQKESEERIRKATEEMEQMQKKVK